MKLYFVGGASGSGKTAIIPALKKILGDSVTVYDFDDIGVPHNADKKWRQESTEKWLQKLLNEDKDACLLGQIVLGEILACPSAKLIKKINFCLLDVSDFERIQRLKKRNTYGTDQNMLNWSSWLRMHHRDPQWMQHALKEDGWQGLDFTVWDQLDNWDGNAVVSNMDTTGYTVNQVAKNVADWIHKTKAMPALLKLHDGYQLDNSTEEAYEYILAESLAFDEKMIPFTQTPKRVEINFVIKHQGEVVGGIYADLYHWNILYVCIIFVEEAHRNKKLGAILLNKVEEQAKSMGCKLSHVDTYDFQAKDFYLKQGYEVFGILNDCPEGHKRYYLKKSLIV